MSLQVTSMRHPQPGQLDLPPGFEAVTLRELGDALGHAARIAAERGAGTLVHVRRFDRIEFAVILEPDEPLAGARRALYASMNAVGDALAAHAPPEKPVVFVWPDTLLIDGGIVGGARLAWPEGTAEDAVPDWLVAGFVLRAVTPILGGKPGVGAHPLDELAQRGTSLATEGFEMLDGAALISSFARHLMLHVDLWHAKGFAPVGQSFLDRMSRAPGTVRSFDANGDLLARKLPSLKQVERQPLLAALAAPGWLDPETEEPWL